MKIVLDKGEKLENAIKYLSDFLSEYCSDYPILKGKLNLYLTLKNSKNQICPDNEKEYIISDGQVIDVLDENEKDAFNTILDLWNDYFKYYKRQTLKIRKSIENDEVYINTAEEKQRKKENLEKRIVEYEKHKLSLAESEEFEETLVLLNSSILENRIKVFYIKNEYGSSYKYKLDVVFVFENINGFNGYFDKRGLHIGELPEFYK